MRNLESLEVPSTSECRLSFRLRGGRWLAASGWLVWLPIALALTWKPYRDHFAHFRAESILWMALLTLAAVVACHYLMRWPIVRVSALPVVAGSGLTGLLIFEPWATLVTLTVLLACYGGGRFVREHAGLSVPPGSEDIAFSAGLGFAGLSLALFWLGILTLFRPIVFVVLLASACFGFRHQIKHLWASCQSLRRSFVSVLEERDAAVSVGVVLGGAFLLIGFVALITPALGPDFLQLHLPSVQHFTAEQGLALLPFQDYSYHPKGVEVLMTLGNCLAGQAAAEMIPTVFFLLLLLLIPPIARELRLGAGATFLSIVFVVALPFLHRSTVFSKNDLALAFFQAAALLCYFHARRHPGGSWLRLGVVFLAASFAVKHVALFGAIPVGLLYLAALRRHPRPFREAVILTALFAAVALPWHIRTFSLTGSPVYPHGLDQATEVLGRGQNAPAGRSKIGYFLVPLAVLYRGDYFFESASRNPLGILFIVFVGAWFLVRRNGRVPAERICLVFVLVYYLYWAAIWPVIRYAIVPIMLLALIMSGRIAALREHAGGLVRVLTLSAWTYCLFFSLLVTLVIEVRPGQLGYLAGQIGEADYLMLNDNRYASLAFLSEQAGRQDLIYGVQICAAGFVANPARFNCSYALVPEREKNKVFESLRKRRYRYLILPNRPWGQAWASQLAESYSLDPLHRDTAYTVYRLDPR